MFYSYIIEILNNYNSTNVQKTCFIKYVIKSINL